MGSFSETLSEALSALSKLSVCFLSARSRLSRLSLGSLSALSRLSLRFLSALSQLSLGSPGPLFALGVRGGTLQGYIAHKKKPRTTIGP
jgi:hypothetical protein